MAILTNQVTKKDLQNIIGQDPAPPETLDTLGELAEAIQGIEGINDIQAFQDEVDRIETSIGEYISTDGSWVAPVDKEYITGAESISDALNLLDNQLSAEATARSSEDINLANDLSDEIDRATGIEQSLQLQITTEKERIDTILDGANVDLDQFKEVVDYINSIDLENDNALLSEVNARIDADLALSDRLDTLESDPTTKTYVDGLVEALQDELDATQNGAGLSQDGTYIVPSESPYINESTSLYIATITLANQIESHLGLLNDEIQNRIDDVDLEQQRAMQEESAIDGKLDQEILDRQFAVDTEIDRATTAEQNLQNQIDSLNGTSSDIQDELDQTQLGAGLEIDGTYSANLSAEYIGAASSLKDADNKLDAALLSVDNRVVTAEGDIDTLQGDVLALEGRLDTAELNISGLTNDVSTIEGRLDGIDSSISDLQTEVNNIETSIGLNEDGTKSNFTSTNVITANSSIKVAIEELDTAFSGLDSNVGTKANQEEVDNIEAAIGVMIDIDGNFVVPDESRYYIDAATSITNAIELLDTALNSAEINLADETLNRVSADNTLQDNIDDEILARQDADLAINSDISAVKTGAGLNINGSFTPPEGSQFLGATTSIKSALSALDTNLATVFNDFDIHHLHSNSFYANEGVSDIQTVHDLAGFGQGDTIYVSSGSFGGDDLSLSKSNFLIECPLTPNGSTISELSGGRGLTISGPTCTRIKIVNLQVEGNTLISDTEGRHYFQNVDFIGTVTLNNGVNNFIVFDNCNFSSGVLIDVSVAATVYFNNCNFNNSQIVSNVALATNVILIDCSGLQNTQQNLAGLVFVGRTSFANSAVYNYQTASRYVYNLGTGATTSFTGSYSELRDKPTLVTASTDLSDSVDLLRTSDAGESIAPLVDGIIPSEYLPSLALTQVHTVADETERLNLPNVHTLNEGDVAVQTDDGSAYIWDGADWVALGVGGAITSVNTKTGPAVTLETNDISEPVLNATNLWFTNQRAVDATIVDSMVGNEQDKAPSVDSVKTYISSELGDYVLSSNYEDADVLAKIKNVDGPGSGLDADLFDGMNSDVFVQTSGNQSIAGTKTITGTLIVPNQAASDSSTKAANTKYVDDAITQLEINAGANGTVIYKGEFNITTNTPSLTTAKKGYLYTIVTDGTYVGVDFLVNDQILFVADVQGGVVADTDFVKIDNTEATLAVGGQAMVFLANGVNKQLATGTYNIYSGAANATLSLPYAKGTAAGTTIILRHTGTGTLTIVGNTYSGGPNSTGAYGTKIIYNNTGNLRSLTLTRAGEYKFFTTSSRSVIIAAPLGVPQYDYEIVMDCTVTNATALRTTDDLVEGATNKYASATTVRGYFSAGTGITLNAGQITNSAPYSDTSVRAAVSAGTGLSYVQASGQFSLNAGIDLLSDVVTSGANSPVSGQALIWNGTSWVPTSIPAGYSDEQAQDAINTMLTAGSHTGISYSYNDNGNALSSTVSLSGFSTTNLTEGTNLYYTQERVEDAVNTLITAGSHTGISYSYTDNGTGAGSLSSTVSLGGFSIDALSDVDTTTTPPTNEQALVWDSATSKWIPQDILSSGAVDVVTLNSNGGSQTLEKNKLFQYATPPLANATLIVPGQDASTAGMSIWIRIRTADNVYLRGSSTDGTSIIYYNNQLLGEASLTKLEPVGEYRLLCTQKQGGVAVYEVSVSNAKAIVSSDDLPEGDTNLYYSDALVSDYIDTVKAEANGLASLDGDGKLPVAQLPISVTTVYADKQLYYIGELMPLNNSQYWKVLKDIYLLEAHFELQNTPTGAGSTTIKLIRNNDLNDVLYSAIFIAGDLTKITTQNISLNQYDKVSLAITSVTDGFHGSDLVVSIYYSRTEE